MSPFGKKPSRDRTNPANLLWHLIWLLSPCTEAQMPSNKHVPDTANTDAHDTNSHVSRREFLRSAAAASGGALLLGSAGSVVAKSTTLPKPNKSGINHIVLVTMENRSFDHFLGWLPGANGVQAGLSYTDTSGNTYSTYALSDYQGCGHADPDHSYAGGRVQYDNGKPYVEVETSPQTFVRHDVELGLSDGLKVEVLKGVAQGDKIKIPDNAGPASAGSGSGSASGAK